MRRGRRPPVGWLVAVDVGLRCDAESQPIVPAGQLKNGAYIAMPAARVLSPTELPGWLPSTRFQNSGGNMTSGVISAEVRSRARSGGPEPAPKALRSDVPEPMRGEPS